MSYLNAETIEKSILQRSVMFGEPVQIQTANNLQNIPGLKIKGQEEWANAEACNICKQPFNPQRNVNRHHCRLCACSACGECSRKRINNQRVCDLCFLKQYLKKQEHERKEHFRLKEQHIETMNEEIGQFDSEIQALEKQIIAIDKANIEVQIANSKEVESKQKEIEEKEQKLKKGVEEADKKKKEHLLRREELESREDRNKMFSSKVQIIKLDISSKQAALLDKMEELERLKMQIKKLDGEREDFKGEFR